VHFNGTLQNILWLKLSKFCPEISSSSKNLQDTLRLKKLEFCHEILYEYCISTHPNTGVQILFHNMLPTIEVIYFVQKSLLIQNKNLKCPKLPCCTVRPWRPKLNSETITFWITKSFRKNKIEFLDLSELKVEE
jgi:hypothetical protein